MKPDYLTLSDGRQVRMEWNMNALSEFVAVTGREITDFATNKADIKTLRTIAWCSAVEGEAADGKELGLTEIEFGRLMTMTAITLFSEILTRQIHGTQKKNNKFRFPRMNFRTRD